MDCQTAREYLSQEIDGLLPAEQQAELAQHCQACADCRRERETAQALHRAFAAQPQAALPENFSFRLKQTLEQENRQRPRCRPVYAKGWFKGLAVAACLLLLLGVGSVALDGLRMGGGYSYDSASADTAAPAESPMMLRAENGGGEYDASAQNQFYGETKLSDDATTDTAAADSGASAALTGGENAAMMERKIIKDVYLRLKVDDFDAAYQQLNDMAQNYGGYPVSGQVYSSVDDVTASGFLSLRVDAAALDTVLATIGQIGQITEENFSTNDVTSDYYDIQGRLEQYQAQETRLLELYQKAGTIEDLIKLEQELTRVQVELDSLQGTLRYYDQMTALSLISIDLYTPSVYDKSVEPQGFAGFWLDVKEAFLNGINGMLDFVAEVLLLCVRLLPLLVVLGVVLFLILRHRHKKKKS